MGTLICDNIAQTNNRVTSSLIYETVTNVRTLHNAVVISMCKQRLRFSQGPKNCRFVVTWLINN